MRKRWEWRGHRRRFNTDVLWRTLVETEESIHSDSTKGTHGERMGSQVVSGSLTFSLIQTNKRKRSTNVKTQQVTNYKFLSLQKGCKTCCCQKINKRHLLDQTMVNGVVLVFVFSFFITKLRWRQLYVMVKTHSFFECSKSHWYS